MADIEIYRELRQQALNNMNNDILTHTRGFRGLGYMFGLMTAMVQILNASEYFDDGHAIGPEVNSVGILADVFMIIQGYILICLVSSYVGGGPTYFGHLTPPPTSNPGHLLC